MLSTFSIVIGSFLCSMCVRAPFAAVAWHTHVMFWKLNENNRLGMTYVISSVLS